MKIAEFQKKCESLLELTEEKKQLLDKFIYKINKIQAIANTDQVQITDFLAVEWLTSKNKEERSWIDEFMSVTDNEQYPEITEKKMLILDNLKTQITSFDEDTRNGVLKAIDLAESYKGSQIKMAVALAQAKNSTSENENFNRGYEEALKYLNAHMTKTISNPRERKRLESKQSELNM